MFVCQHSGQLCILGKQNNDNIIASFFYFLYSLIMNNKIKSSIICIKIYMYNNVDQHKNCIRQNVIDFGYEESTNT